MGRAVAGRGRKRNLKKPGTNNKPDWGKVEHKFGGRRHLTLAVDETELDKKKNTR